MHTLPAVIFMVKASQPISPFARCTAFVENNCLPKQTPTKRIKSRVARSERDSFGDLMAHESQLSH
jgi:hypothetical protein